MASQNEILERIYHRLDAIDSIETTIRGINDRLEQRIKILEDKLAEIGQEHLKCNVRTSNRLGVLESVAKLKQSTLIQKIGILATIGILAFTSIGSAIWSVAVTGESITNVKSAVLENTNSIKGLHGKVEKNMRDIAVVEGNRHGRE